MEAEKWYASLHEDEYWDAGPFASRADAIAEGPEELSLEPDDTFYTGQAKSPTIVMPNTRQFIECVDEYTTGDLGEFATEWFSDMKEEAVTDLGVRLRYAFEVWLDKHHLRPTFFVIKDTQEHTVPPIQETTT